jgi:hypothetical protein
MNRCTIQFPVFLVAIILIAVLAADRAQGVPIPVPACVENTAAVQLSQPTEYDLSLERVLQQRHSARNFFSWPLALGEVSHKSIESDPVGLCA